jgi:hypothetical protein
VQPGDARRLRRGELLTAVLWVRGCSPAQSGSHEHLRPQSSLLRRRGGSAREQGQAAEPFRRLRVRSICLWGSAQKGLAGPPSRCRNWNRVGRRSPALGVENSPGASARAHCGQRPPGQSPGHASSGSIGSSGCVLAGRPSMGVMSIPGTVRAHPLQKSRHILYTLSLPVILPVCLSIRPSTVV